MISVSSVSPGLIRRTVREYIVITLGLLLYAFGWVGIILPAKIVGGGVSGISLLIFFATGGESGGGIPLMYSMLAINGILIVLATAIIGFKFSAKTLYAVLMLAFLMGLLQKTIPPDLLGLADDQLLSAILAGAVAGIGIGMCFSQGGSMGGTDIIAMIINKYRSVSYGRVIMACDFVIIGMSYFIGNELQTVIYSFVVVGVLGYTLDAFLSGNKQSSQIFIISRKNDEIASRINMELGRGVTMLNGIGWYTREPAKVAMVLCRKSENSNMFRIIRDVDPEAFISVGSVMGVYGRGFENLAAVKASGGKKHPAASGKTAAAEGKSPETKGKGENQ